MGLRAIGHVETFPVVARLHKLTHGDPWKNTPDCAQMVDADLPHKTLLLRCQKAPSVENFPADLPMHDQPEYEKFPVWKNLVARARKLILADPVMRDAIDAAAPLGRVVVSVLAPKSLMTPHKDVGDYAKRHLRFHAPLVTNPHCTLYAGNSQAHLPVGLLTWIDVLDLHWAANWAQAGARSHLIFELRRRDAGGDE
jgi:hypothetical protein